MSLLALIPAAMHSSPRFKGKLTERWGRKASGLRDACAYDSGVAGRFPDRPRIAHADADPKARLQNAWVRHGQLYLFSAG